LREAVYPKASAISIFLPRPQPHKNDGYPEDLAEENNAAVMFVLCRMLDTALVEKDFSRLFGRGGRVEFMGRTREQRK